MWKAPSALAGTAGELCRAHPSGDLGFSPDVMDVVLFTDIPASDMTKGKLNPNFDTSCLI
jgi:hypothetical protein